MNYLKLILIVINVMIFCNQASTQINYSGGHLIRKSNEKVEGLIRLESETKLSYAVQYKKDKKSPTEIFTANDIKGFSTVDGWYFESFEVLVDKKPKQLFLRKVIDGYVDLYTLKLGANTRYFILTQDKVLEEIKESLSQENMKVIKRYQGIRKLRILFSDCERVLNEIDEDFVVNKKTLVDIVQKYNFCKSNDYGTDLKLRHKTAFGLNAHSSFVGRNHIGVGLELEFYPSILQDYASINVGACLYENTFDLSENDILPLSNYWIRLNGYLIKNQRFAPYIFLGYSYQEVMLKTEFGAIKTIAKAAYLGGGCNAYISKNIFLKAELSYTTYSEIRIGLGAKF